MTSGERIVYGFRLKLTLFALILKSNHKQRIDHRSSKKVSIDSKYLTFSMKQSMEKTLFDERKQQ